ncbi:DNA-binding response regulator [Caulobacter zeae]|uniref:DNA-binding response regulator n=3 Tax=Caulobacteraceae TaxID=76892 RepID=A0A2T9JEJ7_9CAUL|nr:MULTISPECIES: response regulator transcription factor [Caulobacter]PLR22666.1 DNA-binding response regulator [Caulobacter zeae]PVM82115.1 DNA-binding response regulator [Caulobacter endophyticus]
MRALLIEDNVRLGQATMRSLVKAGFAIDLFETIDDGWHAWRSVAYEAVILDIILGQDSGLDLLAKARAAGLRTPVLMLTALGSVDQRVQGLEQGADDYLVKPFAIEELVARLRALGRRPALTAAGVMRYGRLRYDQSGNEISVGEARSPLSRGESIVLERCLRHPERVVSRSQLGESLHSLDQDYTDNSIQMHVHRVRRKMADLGADVTIRALRGLGYMLVRLEGGAAVED